MVKVERIQYQAALAITCAWQGSNRSKICDQLGWETLSDHHKYRRVLQIHKIINNRLNEKLPPYCREMFSGNVRTSFHAIKCKSYRYMNSFFPDAIASWNLFIEDASHFLFPCPSYTVQRVTLVNSVKEILLKVNLIHLEDHSKLYLYGDPCINNSSVNKTIILSTIKYIKETQRFAT